MLKLDLTKVPKISFTLASIIFIPIIFYPPLFLMDRISVPLRIILLVLLTVYLFLATKRYIKTDLFICTLFAILVASLVIVNFNDSEGMRTVGSFMLTLFFAYALSRAAAKNGHIKGNLIKTYTTFFTIVPIFAFFSIIYYLILGELNLFGFNFEESAMKCTPFGFLLRKSLLGIGVYRSFFFFIEPVYLAFFYAANIFLVAPYLKGKSNLFLFTNILGGLLTFSYLFIILSIILFVSKDWMLNRRNAFRVILILVLIVILPVANFFSVSSSGDRIYRMNLFLYSMSEANISQVLFGQGFATQTGADQGFSAGILTSIFEIGIINLFVIVLFVLVMSNQNRNVFILFLVPMLVFEPIKLPLFWVLLVVLTVLLPNGNQQHSKIIEKSVNTNV